MREPPPADHQPAKRHHVHLAGGIMALTILGILIALLVLAGWFIFRSGVAKGHEDGLALVMIAAIAWGAALLLSIAWICLAIRRWAP